MRRSCVTGQCACVCRLVRVQTWPSGCNAAKFAIRSLVMPAEPVGVAGEPDVIGKRRVAVAAGENVGNASRAITIDGLADGRGQDLFLVHILCAEFKRNREAGTAEAEAVPDQVVRWNAFHARAEVQRQTA